MSNSVARMASIVALLMRRKAHTSALCEDLSRLIEEQTSQGKTNAEAIEALFGGENNTVFRQLQEVLSEFYAIETQFLVSLGIAEVVPVANAAEAAAEAAELMTRAGKGH